MKYCGPGSGNFGHIGRPGQVGGAGVTGGGVAATPNGKTTGGRRKTFNLKKGTTGGRLKTTNIRKGTTGGGPTTEKVRVGKREELTGADIDLEKLDNLTPKEIDFANDLFESGRVGDEVGVAEAINKRRKAEKPLTGADIDIGNLDNITKEERDIIDGLIDEGLINDERELADAINDIRAGVMEKTDG